MKTDLTREACEWSASGDVLTVIAVPVYGGKVAPLALKRMEQIRGNGTPAVLIVVYGNRAYGGALNQLDAWAVAHGFVPIAAGTFIGEHSYSTVEFPTHRAVRIAGFAMPYLWGENRQRVESAKTSDCSQRKTYRAT